MRHAQVPTILEAEPQSELARRLASGVSIEEMMRRGEIGGQALGLIQMMAGQAASEDGPRAHARGSVQNPVEFN
ncbi:MAG: hypothetical protein NCW75_02605 [Phycisphaera sp.]|nr:MAG: hypothetical protein NCW75_02605 [Phycisphaera sp.]